MIIVRKQRAGQRSPPSAVGGIYGIYGFKGTQEAL